MPFFANYYLGTADHKLQLGVGITPIAGFGSASMDPLVVSSLSIGYRYIPPEGDFLFSSAIPPSTLSPPRYASS